jgi:fimbrial isopeptide formation D2 family protein/uncharacterized repeat protein (TIGR01451 family)
MGFGWSNAVYAEGSRDLTGLDVNPVAGNGGNRPFLDFRNDNLGEIQRQTTIKVYAAQGETINLASSAMASGLGGGAGDIRFTSPDGTTSTCSTAAPGTGFIRDIDQERAGSGTGYIPCTLPVGAGQTGVWEIQFISPNQASPIDPPPTLVTDPWTQPTNVGYVAAWDVTVRNSGGTEISGRAYANYLALNLGGNDLLLNSIPFIQTDLGYLYRVNLNGLDPFGFIFFANNKGFTTQPCPEGNPTYRSIPLNPLPNFCSPALPDNDDDVTYKIFFNQPSQDLPLEAPVAGGGSTWLRNNPQPIPTVSDLAFEGAQGTPGRAGSDPALTLGGNFSFNTSSPGFYSIVIDVNRDGVFGNANDVILQDSIDQVNAGPITVLWNGTDSNGDPLPAGLTPYVSELSFYVGDVHFPFLDPENNTRGLIIQRVNPTTLVVENDRVYYNDDGLQLIGGPTSPISALDGVPSTSGAHRFGDRSFTGFGNLNGIDTWTSLVDPITLRGGILIQKADLSINKTDNPDPVAVGDAISYTLTVTSNPPVPPDIYSNVAGARVTDTVPPEITGVSWSCAIPSGGACGTASGTGNTIDLTVDLNVGATATITVNGTVSSAGSGTLTNTANVARPPDVFDPNLANNTDNENTTITASPVQPIGTKSARLLTDTDGSGTVTSGDIIEYTVTYTNQQPDIDITDFLATDSLDPNNLSLVAGSYSLTATGAQTTVTANPNFNGTTNTNLNTAGTLGRGGGQVVVRYQAQITAPPGTQISNQATATSNGGTVPLSLTDARQGAGDLPQIGDDGTNQGNLPSTGDDEPTLITVGNPTPNPVQPVGTKSARLLTDRDNTGSVTPGDIIEYTVTYSNTQPGTDITDFLATDSLDPNNLSLVAGSYSLTATGAQTTITANPNFNGTSNTNLNTAGTLGRGGGQVVIKYQAQIIAPAGTQISNQATATSNGGTVPLSITDALQGAGDLPQTSDDGTDQGNLPSTGDDEPTLITVGNPTPNPVQPVGTKSARLLTDSDGSGTVTAGDIIEYTVTYSNQTPDTDITDFLATDRLDPNNLSLVAGSYSLTATGAQTTITANPNFNGTSNTNLNTAGTLGRGGGQVVIRYQAQIIAPAGTQISNQATATSNGGTVPVSITDARQGAGDLPQTSDDGTDQGNLPSTGDDEPTLIVVANPTPNPVQPVGTKSARLLTDRDNTGSVTPGDIIEYTVTYTNAQPGTDITDFLATDSLDPNNLSLVAGSYSLTATGAQTTITANPNFNGTSNTNLNTAGTLGRGGGQVVIKYQAQIIAPAGTQISNQATATSNGGTVPVSITDALQGAGDLPQTGDDGTDQGNLPSTGDDEPTLIVVANPTPNPIQPVGTKSARLLTDSDGSGSVTSGDIIEYTVTYSNQTPDTDITDFLATDRLDSNNLSLVAGSYSLTATGAQTTITANPNFNGTSNTNLNTAGTLGRGGGQVVIKYQAQIIAPAGTQISNQASATSIGGTVNLSLTDAVQDTGDLPQTGDNGIDQGNLPSTGDDEPTLITVGNSTPNPVQPFGTKSARIFTDTDQSGSVTAGDIIEYTVTYTNQQPDTNVIDFLATDSLDRNNLSFVPGSYSLTATGAQTTITPNPNFNGTTNTNLNTAGTLGRGGGQVVIKYQAQITAPPGTQISNQAEATSNGGTVALSRTDAIQGLGGLPQLGDDGTNQGNLPDTTDDDATLITVSASGPARLRLVKRITTVTRGGVPITGFNFSSFVDDPNDDNDTAAGWSQLPTNAPVGAVTLGSQATLQSGDEVEYTVYFLSDGSQTSQNIKFCDPIPTGTTFIADSFGSGRGILLNRGGTQTPQTNDADTDSGAFFSPLTAVTTPPCSDSNNPNGSVFLQMGDIPNTAPTNVGFVRFRVRID